MDPLDLQIAEIGRDGLAQLDGPRSRQLDEEALARVGKKSVLKRKFGFMSILGLSCTILITWEGVLVAFIQAFRDGGPAGAVYGYLFVWAGTFSTFATLGELASMAPTSGGQYHWCAMLASPSAKFYSYITGWLTVAGWQALFASTSYISGTLVQGLIVLTCSDYSPQSWHGVLLCISIIILAFLINVVGTNTLPNFEGLVLILHILGFFAILIPLTYLGDHRPASEVFTTFFNDGNLQTQGLSVFVGLSGNVYAFLGADAAVHMSEEIHDAAILVPRTILFSVTLNGALGFGMLIAVLFSVGDINRALMTPTGYPFIEIFYEATRSTAGSAVMVSITGIMGMSASVGMLASASRQLWSFSRDRGVPGWTVISKVHQRTSIPVYASVVTATMASLLSLIAIGSSTTFSDLVSIPISCLFLSYLISCFLLLYRRCTGRISPPMATHRGVINTVGAELIWGPYHIPATFGIVVNVLSIVYMIVVVFFSYWPPVIPVTVSSMNYSSAVTAGVVASSILYYYVSGRKVYEGPTIEVDASRR